MEELRFAVALLCVCALTAAWGLLLLWTHQRLMPRIERWLWRVLGGEGEPPGR